MTKRTTEEWLRESIRKLREENTKLRSENKEIKSENSALKRRISSTVHYIERASAWSFLNSDTCYEVMDVVVDTLTGIIR